MYFSCPSCQTSLDLSKIAQGAVISCPRCGQRFQKPMTQTMPPQSPAALPTVSAPPPLPGLPTKVAVKTPRQKLRQWQEANSVFDAFFDWQFQRYVTPKVVKFFWIIAVINAVLILLAPFILPALSISLVAAAQSSGPRMRIEPPPGTESVFGTGIAILTMILSYAWFALMVIAALLWIRLILESIIVIFDISTCARSIDQTLRDNSGIET
jgi:hypothetical protein